MIKNSTLQNDLADTFSVWTKVNDVDNVSYPVIYNFFSFNASSVFIKRNRTGQFEVCVTGLPLNTFIDTRTLYNIANVTTDYYLAQNFFRGYVKRILDLN